MDPARLEALLESVQAVQDAISDLEREVMAALAALAAWLKVGRTTVYRLITSRAVPSYRIGRSVRVRRVDVAPLGPRLFSHGA